MVTVHLGALSVAVSQESCLFCEVSAKQHLPVAIFKDSIFTIMLMQESHLIGVWTFTSKGGKLYEEAGAIFK